MFLICPATNFLVDGSSAAAAHWWQRGGGGQPGSSVGSAAVVAAERWQHSSSSTATAAWRWWQCSGSAAAGSVAALLTARRRRRTLFIFIIFLSNDKINPAIGVANPFVKFLCNFLPHYHKFITFIKTHNLRGIGTFLLDLEVESVILTMRRFDNQVVKVFVLFILHDIIHR
jgi:hypothetical protein